MKERLNKIIAKSGICSRRKADELIARGRVKINGKVITALGTQADMEKDMIEVNNKRLGEQEKIYIVLNKPRGYITTAKDIHAEKTVFDLLPKKFARVFPVGRLDKNTEGLLLLTNDGDIAQRLLHPKFEIDRIYELSIKGELSSETKEQIETGGLVIEDYKTSPCKIKILSRSKLKTRLKLTLHEGRKREIRKIFDLFGHNVMSLKRVQFGNIKLENLSCGKWTYIKKPVF